MFLVYSYRKEVKVGHTVWTVLFLFSQRCIKGCATKQRMKKKALYIRRWFLGKTDLKPVFKIWQTTRFWCLKPEGWLYSVRISLTNAKLHPEIWPSLPLTVHYLGLRSLHKASNLSSSHNCHCKLSSKALSSSLRSVRRWLQHWSASGFG